MADEPKRVMDPPPSYEANQGRTDAPAGGGTDPHNTLAHEDSGLEHRVEAHETKNSDARHLPTDAQPPGRENTSADDPID